MKSPWEIATGKTEHGEQTALFQWCNAAYWAGFENAWEPSFYARPAPLKPHMSVGCRVPELRWYHAIHNQGHGDAIRGGMAKAEGVKAGIPDTFLPIPRPMQGYSGLYVELKLVKYATHKDGGLNEAQEEAIRDLRNAGYDVAVCYGWADAARTLQTYIQS